MTVKQTAAKPMTNDLMTNERINQWQMTAPKEPFTLQEAPLPEPGSDEALLQVAGCGVCHTDLSFWHFGVKTRHELPLTLGHEISGKVIAGPERLVGKKVIVPAVIPCGECDLCHKGRSNVCQNQIMPGNDFHGGFASHMKVPARYLCEASERVLENYALEELAVIADAVSTPYQVIEKAEFEAGDLAIAIGVGGIGIFGVQLAKYKGAKVIALDINEEALAHAKEVGVDAILNIKDMDGRAVKQKVREIAKEIGAPKYGWKILEMSGTKPGQELGFSLLTFASTLSVVGFTMDKLELRLSNLMAFDAKAIGTWGCKAELYPQIVKLVAEGAIKVKPFIQKLPMSQINEVFKNTLNHKY